MGTYELLLETDKEVARVGKGSILTIDVTHRLVLDKMIRVCHTQK